MLMSSHQMALGNSKWDMKSILCLPKANHYGEYRALGMRACSRDEKSASLSKAMCLQPLGRMEIYPITIAPFRKKLPVGGWRAA